MSCTATRTATRVADVAETCTSVSRRGAPVSCDASSDGAPASAAHSALISAYCALRFSFRPQPSADATRFSCSALMTFCSRFSSLSVSRCFDCSLRNSTTSLPPKAILVTCRVKRFVPASQSCASSGSCRSDGCSCLRTEVHSATSAAVGPSLMAVNLHVAIHVAAAPCGGSRA
eukprot:2722114-Prymnesium_polylepis.1